MPAETSRAVFLSHVSLSSVNPTKVGPDAAGVGQVFDLTPPTIAMFDDPVALHAIVAAETFGQVKDLTYSE